MAADGNLIFNTKIDESGFNKGAKNLSSKVIDIKNKISSTEAQVKSLKAELEKTGDVKVKTKAAEAIEKDLAKANEKVRNYAAQSDEIINKIKADLGDMYNDGALEYLLNQNTEWGKLQEKISKAWAEVEKYKKELEQVNAAAPLTKDTAEYKQKEQKVEELTGKLEMYRAKQREAEAAEKSSNAQNKRSASGIANVKAKLDQTISALKTFANGARRAGNILKTAFSKTAGKAISGIREHFKKANNSTNVLEKSLRRIKNTLIRMFFFRLVHSPIDAIKDGLGEIAKISPEVNKNLSALKTESTYLKNSFAALAAPLVNLLAPAFVSFFQTLSNVTTKAGQLVAVLTGQSYTKAVKVQQDYAASLDESTKSADKNTKALEKNQKALAGFDELNVLDQSDTDTESAGAATSPMFENLGDTAQGLSKSLLDAFKRQDFNAVGEMFAEKINSALGKINWTKIKKTAKGLAENIAGFLNGFIGKTNWNLVGTTLANGIGTALTFANRLIKKFDFSKLGSALGNFINGFALPDNAAKLAENASLLISGLFNALATAVKTVKWDNISFSIISFITHFKFSAISTGAIRLVNGFADALGKIDFKQIGEAFRSGLSRINWKGLWNGVTRLTTNALQGLADFFGLKGISTGKLKRSLQDLYKPVSDLYSTLKNSIGSLLKPAINELLPAAVKLIQNIVKGAQPIIEGITPILETAVSVIAQITKSLAPAIGKIGKAIGTIIKDAAPVIEPALKLIGNIASILAPVIEFIAGAVEKIDSFLSPINGFVGDIIGGVSNLFGWLSGDNGNITISAQLQEEIDHLAGASDGFNTIRDNISGAISAIDENIQGTMSDLGYIDGLQSRLDELMNKATLSDSEMQELKTIGDLLSEKLPGFEKTWNSMIKIDESGKLVFTKNRAEAVKSIDEVINKLKEQYAVEALQEQYKEALKAKQQAAQDYSAKLGEASTAQEKLNKLGEEMTAKNKELAEAEKQFWGGNLSSEDYNKKVDAAKKARAEYDEYKKTFENLQENALKAGGKIGEMDKKLENLSTVMTVVKSGGDGLYNSLQGLRTAFDYGLIDMDTITKNTGKNAKELFAQTKSLAEQSAAGYEKGIADSEKTLTGAGVTLATDAIDGARKGLDSHSPSKEFIAIGGDSAEGLSLGFSGGMNKVFALVKSLAQRMTSTFNSGLANMGSVFSTLPTMARTAFNSVLSLYDRFLEQLTSGLNGSLAQINQINKAFAQSGGKNLSYTVINPLPKIPVPRLATGAFVPANYGEFLAVLGDNKREAEVVSPVSAMKQAFMEAMLESGMIGGDGEKEINLFIDGDKFFSWIIGKSNQYKKSHGNSPFQGANI